MGQQRFTYVMLVVLGLILWYDWRNVLMYLSFLARVFGLHF